MIETMLKILNFVIAYIAIAILTDLFLIKKYPSELDRIEKKYDGKATEIEIVLFWPIFWVGYILAIIFNFK